MASRDKRERLRLVQVRSGDPKLQGKEVLYRIAQEALNNIAKHEGAQYVVRPLT